MPSKVTGSPIGYAQGACIQTFETWNKIYFLDDDGFLVNPLQWSEDFVEKLAPRLGISEDLTPSHWNMLRFIRALYPERGSCPTAYETCEGLKLSKGELERFFPAGYRCGACKLAGICSSTNDDSGS